ncbi:hypothetical protein MFAL_13390 [Mycolicibacterium fallax]|nr:hypothetical protein MFAL_13390 [Mycolicibacterium fallax]
MLGPQSAEGAVRREGIEMFDGDFEDCHICGVTLGGPLDRCNPAPVIVTDDDRVACCSACNIEFVLPARAAAAAS